MANGRDAAARELHPTVDSNYRADRYDAKNIFANDNNKPNEFGIRNQNKVVRMKPAQIDRPVKSRSGQKSPTPAPRALISNRRRSVLPRQMHRPAANLNRAPLPGLKQLAIARGVSSGLAALAWTFCLWLLVQLPFAILNLIALGLWAWKESEKTTLIGKAAGAALAAIEKTAQFLGIIEDIDVFASFFSITWVVTIVTGIIAIGGVVLQSSFALLHPVSGRKASLKLALLAFAMVGYIVPGMNLFPWIWLHILIMMRYPK